MLDKLNKLKNWQAGITIAVIGFAVFSGGLNNPFQGDDIPQIINNIPVHSISNIKLFFEGGTFYNGQGIAPLSGVYYRPLMTTVFSLIYTPFGPHPFYYHFVQLLLCIGSSILLYLFFRYSFKPLLALFLSLVFLIHPINSQVVFAIPSMQDSLFFFFGILGLFLLVKYVSNKIIPAVALCFFLSLMSKETGILFVSLALIYLFWWNRERFFKFVFVIAVPIGLWIVLKINAVGLNSNPKNAPIDNLSFVQRLITAPSEVMFFMDKLIFPWRLATAYYWVDKTVTLRYFFLPLILELAIITMIIYLTFWLKKNSTRANYFTFMFFSIWCALGLLVHLQITPLDFTTSEPWFYFSMAGVLGMIGIIYNVFLPKLRVNSLLIIGICLITVLGVRTYLRGFDYRSSYILDSKDVIASKDDYSAYDGVAQIYINEGKYSLAKSYTLSAINIYPTFNDYMNLGAILTFQGNYSNAMSAYTHGINYGPDDDQIYENIGLLTLVNGSYGTDHMLLINGLKLFPKDGNLWLYIALLDENQNNLNEAHDAINNAAIYKQINPAIYNDILENKPFVLNLANIGINKTISIK